MTKYITVFSKDISIEEMRNRIAEEIKTSVFTIEGIFGLAFHEDIVSVKVCY